MLTNKKFNYFENNSYVEPFLDVPFKHLNGP